MKKPLLIIFMSTLMLNAYSQADQHWLPKKLSISVKEEPLENVLKQLEKEMEGVVFAYSPGTFDVKRKVSIEADELPLNEILHRIFKDQNLECAEMRGKIFLKKKKKTSSGRQSTPTPRRKRILKADVRKKPVAQSEQKPVNKPLVLKEPADTNRVQPVSTDDNRVTPLPAEQTAEEPPKKLTGSKKPSPAIMAIIDEMTSPARVRSAPTIKPVEPVRKQQAVSDFDQYRIDSFESPAIPPLPMDTTNVVRESPKPEKVKKKREKKERPPREPEEKKFRIYGASTTALTAMGNDAAIKMGGRAVWLKNSRFGIGLAGYALQGPANTDPALSNDTYKLAGGYGGLLLEYNLNPNKAIHLSFPLVVAGGAMTYVQKDITLNNLPRAFEDQRVIAIVEPGAMLEFNVVKYVKVALDVSYRYTSFAELNYEDTGDVILAGGGLNNFSGGVTVKFGIF